MPVIAPLVKQSRCRAYGAEVELFGQNIGEAKELADQFVEERGLTYVHGFDGAHVINGQGTIGLEIMEQVPEVDAVIVPIGGAGLIAGIGLAVKTMRPSVRIVGVEPENAATYSAALRNGSPVLCDMKPTLADGLSVPRVGERAFRIAKETVDEVVQVDEECIALSILRLLEMEKGVVEGGGASALAALLAGKLPHLHGKTVVLILCGGNIDPAILGRVIEHGLVADGRLARFRTVISDRPGGLAKLATALAASGASVKQIIHDRAFASADVSKVEVECIVETRDQEHLLAVKALLADQGMHCR
jgi:threonine dehydratase